MLKWILLVEGEEAGHAAANVAWYFFKGSIGNKWYTRLYSTNTSQHLALVSTAHATVFGGLDYSCSIIHEVMRSEA